MDAAQVASALAEHDGLIRHLVYRRLKPGEDGDDALQDARIAAMTACQSWRPRKGSKLSSWIGTAVTWSMQQRREYWMREKRRGSAVSLDDQRREWEPAIEHEWPDLDDGDDAGVQRILRALCPTDRLIVEYRYWGGLPLAEIGAHLGITRQRVQQRLCRSLHRLRRLFAKDVAHGSD